MPARRRAVKKRHGQLFGKTHPARSEDGGREAERATRRETRFIFKS